MNQDLADFLDILTAWRFGYNKAWCKYFVSKKDGKKFLLHGIFALINPEISEGHKDFYIETSQCIAGQDIFDLTPDFFDKLKIHLTETPHVINTKGQEFHLPMADNQRCSYFFDPLNNSPMRNPLLRISVNNNYGFIPDARKTSLELRTIDTPYDDVQDLFHSLNFPMEILDSSRSPNIQYIMATPLKAISCSVEDRQKLHLNFSFPGMIQKEKFRVGVRLFQKDRSDPRFCLEGKDFKWEISEGQQNASLIKEIQDIEIARIFPAYDGHNIGAYVAADAKFVFNNRLEVDKAFYNELSIRDLLLSKESEEFEFGVSSLLHYYRLSIQRYAGVEILKNGPDLVAFSSSGHIYVIECTTGTVNHKGKLHKLNSRMEKLKNYFQEKGLSREWIRPVIFTNLPKENTTEDRADLVNFKITLVTRDDFEEMIRRIRNPPSDQELFDAALNAIPSKEPERQLPLPGYPAEN